jgi:hypothetical protein
VSITLRARRSLRSSPRVRGAAAAGLALAAALTLSGGGGTAQASSSPAEDCDPSAPSAARVAEGYQGEDPNSVTAEQAAAFEEELADAQGGVAAQGRLGADGTGRGNNHPIRIKTYIHVITAEDGTGRVSPRQVKAQMDVLNTAYAGRTSRHAASSPIRFTLAGVDVTKSDEWYDFSSNEDGTESAAAQEAKRALRRGTWRDLNIYVVDFTDGLLGYATFPFPSEEGIPDLGLDGVAVLNASLPGGTAAPYNEGDTATHEVGHWLGLYHTFQNGCTSPGDYVLDTPYQADGDNIFFCGDWDGDGSTTTPDDTCPQPGVDPVHNFMAYGDDPCLDRFTRLQNRRQVAVWYAFRAGR